MTPAELGKVDVLVIGAGNAAANAALSAHEAGASVALADWNEKVVRSAVEELVAQGHKALGLALVSAWQAFGGFGRLLREGTHRVRLPVLLV